jgi:hypothetical protein
VGRLGVPDVLAGQVPAIDHAGTGLLGGLAHQRVGGGLTGLELTVVEVPEAVVGLDENDEPVGGDAEPVGLGDRAVGVGTSLAPST